MKFSVRFLIKPTHMKKAILIHVFFASALFAFGQNTENPKSKWSVYWHPGSNWINNSNEFTLSGDFEPYLKYSEWYNPKYPYRDNIYRRTIGTNLFSFLNFGVQYDTGNGFSKTDKTSFSIRSGINYLGLSSIQGGNYSIKQVLIDSSYNPSTNITLQSDSIYVERYNVFKSKETIRWQNDITHKHVLFDQVGVYYGVGAAVGLDFNVQLTEKYSEEEYFTEIQLVGERLHQYGHYPYSLQLAVGNLYDYFPVEPEKSKRKLKSEIGYSVYLPFGFDYTLSKNQARFASRISLFCEGQIGLNFDKNAYDDWQSTFYLNHGFGLRFQI